MFLIVPPPDSSESDPSFKKKGWNASAKKNSSGN